MKTVRTCGNNSNIQKQFEHMEKIRCLKQFSFHLKLILQENFCRNTLFLEVPLVDIVSVHSISKDLFQLLSIKIMHQKLKLFFPIIAITELKFQ